MKEAPAPSITQSGTGPEPPADPPADPLTSPIVEALPKNTLQPEDIIELGGLDDSPYQVAALISNEETGSIHAIGAWTDSHYQFLVWVPSVNDWVIVVAFSVTTIEDEESDSERRLYTSHDDRDPTNITFEPVPEVLPNIDEYVEMYINEVYEKGWRLTCRDDGFDTVQSSLVSDLLVIDFS